MSRKRIYKAVSILINAMAFLLASLFAWLQLDKSAFSLINSSIGATVIFRFTLALYYLAWVAGCTFDLHDEEYSFKIIPNNGKLSETAIGIIILFGILFGALCWVDDYTKFLIVLDIFLIYNFFAWRYLIKFLKPTFSQNERLLKGNFNLEYQKILKYYLVGNWQISRFIYGFLVLLLINIVYFTDMKIKISNLVGMKIDTVISIAFFFYIITFELWIWIKRWNRKLSFNIFDDLDEKYYLKKKENAIQKEIIE